MDTHNQHPIGKSLPLIGTFAILAGIYFVYKVVHRLYFDPLSNIPGPKINALSRIPYARHLMGGTTVQNVVALHEKYGDVVRISPNEVSFISGETAWTEIYGFRTGKLKGHLSTQKDPVWYPPPANGVPSILLANDEDHSRGRRLLSHAFSEKALAEQEPLVQKYVDQLVNGLKDLTAKSGHIVDMTKWYNWTTFDIIADLMFGEPFGCLQNFETHKYIALLFQSVAGFRLYYIMRYWPFAKYLGSLVINKKVIKERHEYAQWIADQTSKRIARETDRPDFMTHILQHNGEKNIELSKKELDSNANLIITAGSETTATLLSGATYLLLTNPDKYNLLKQEIRSKFPTYESITLAEVNNNTPYLIAVLNEALRYFPPVPAGFERRIGKGGEVVSGHYIPEGTAVSVSQYPANHSEHHFKYAEKFIPERWMGEEEFVEDKRAVMQPFSFGPRNCLGKNLAYAEMRLIMAKIIWSFDMSLEPRSKNWMKECKVMTLWAKPEMAVRVTEVVR